VTNASGPLVERIFWILGGLSTALFIGTFVGSSPANAVTITPAPAINSAPPTGVAGDTLVTLTIPAPVLVVNSASDTKPPSKYMVTQAKSAMGTFSAVTSGTCASTSTAGNCTVTGLTNGTAYYFKVAVVNVYGVGVASSPSEAITPIAPVTQSIITIANTTLTGTVGIPISLSAAGGSGRGDVTFSTTGTGCSVAGSSLTTNLPGTCMVTATKAASYGYLAATSGQVSFSFAYPAQATLTIANTTKTGDVGTPITLTTSGGSGSGSVSYIVRSGACSIVGASLSATAAATCTVSAKKAESIGYQAAASAAASFTFKTCATGGTCVVGDIGPGGGSVFYVSVNGFNEVGAACSPNCHYLEVAPFNGPNSWVDWKCNPVRESCKWLHDRRDVNTRNAIGAGLSNTRIMFEQDGSPGYAGTIATDFRGPNNLSDWFLPSKDELNELYLAKFKISVGMDRDFYWSSSSPYSYFAWYQDFTTGSQSATNMGSTGYVRPVRAF